MKLYDLQEARYAAPKRTGRELAILIRRGILDTFPQWKPLRRLKVAVGVMGDVADKIYVSLMTGLLDSETVDAFNETGALHDNAQRIGKVIEDATGRTIVDHFSSFDHRERSEEISYNLKPTDK